MADVKLACMVFISSPTNSICSGGGGSGGSGSGDGGSDDEGDLDLLRDMDGKSDGGEDDDGKSDGGEDDDGKSDGGENDDGKSDGGEDDDVKSDGGGVGISFPGRQAKAGLVGRDQPNKAGMRSDDDGAGLMGKVVISSSESDRMKNEMSTPARGVVAEKGVGRGVVIVL
ncbi:hypothetical protein Tco_0003343 [Tanacetum coccineum]